MKGKERGNHSSVNVTRSVLSIYQFLLYPSLSRPILLYSLYPVPDYAHFSLYKLSHLFLTF